MVKEKLTDLLKDADTMQDAFRRLEGKKIKLVNPESGGFIPLRYISLVAKKDFVILEDACSLDNLQVLHPYGSSVVYYFSS